MAANTSHPGARESMPELQDHDPVGHIVEVDIARILSVITVFEGGIFTLREGGPAASVRL